MAQLYREYGIASYVILTLLAMGWFWHRVLVKGKPAYMGVFVILFFPLIFFAGIPAVGVLVPFAMTFLICKVDDRKTPSPRSSLDYLVVLLAIFLLAILCGIII